MIEYGSHPQDLDKENVQGQLAFEFSSAVRGQSPMLNGPSRERRVYTPRTYERVFHVGVFDDAHA